MFDTQHSKRPENDRSQTSPQESSRAKQTIRHTGDLTGIPLYAQAWGNQPPPWLRPGMPQQAPQKREPLQRTTEPTQRKENTTGLPDTLKAGVEHLSGMSMDDVNVHYNSAEPAEVQALAFTQGTDIHMGPGQEKHLAHEAWHVVQQKQGRVVPTLQAMGVAINDDQGLEQEASVMGLKALQFQLTASPQEATRDEISYGVHPVQAMSGKIIQMAPPPAFTNLNPRLPGTPIPLNNNGTWKKPPWLRDANGAAMTMRNILLATMVPVMTVDNQSFYRCPLCSKLGDSNGMGVDHQIDWAEYCHSKNVLDYQGLEYWFHDLDNLHLVHTNCNSSKSTADVFDWWRSTNSDPYINNPQRSSNIRIALERISANFGIDWLYEVPETKRKLIVQGLLEGAMRQNAFDELMANAKIVSAVGGWGKVTEEKKDSDDDENANAF